MDPGASPPRHAAEDASPGSSTSPPSTTPPGLTPDHPRVPNPDTSNENDLHPTVTTSPSSSPAPSAPTPPFWSTSPSARPLSYQSISNHLPHRASVGGGPIQLEDHSEEDHVQAQSCWAESATIDDYVVVSGPTGIGAYVVWHCTVKTLKGGGLEIRKRYSEFATLRANLVRAFPHADAMIPDLPRKSVVSRFRPPFLEARKRGLSHFLNCILLNPEFASSPVLKDFVFS